MSSIGGTQALLRGGDHFDRETDLKWTVSDLYRGITPISLIKEWAPLFATPLSIAHRVIHKFVGYLEKQATELIWKPRCKTTVKHEKERGITAKHKKSKYTGPRGEWSDGYGYIREDEHCHCGWLLEEHEGGICPGPTLDPHEADRTLLQSLLGKRHLGTMERMGRIDFW